MTSDLLQGFYLGDFLVEPLKGQVTGRVGSTHLPPKASEVLLCLARSPGELVTREKLLKKAWGSGHGSPEALSHAISEIRHALDDHADNPVFVQTLPRRGYRLAVEPIPAEEHAGSIVLGTKDGAQPGDIGFLENLRRRGVFETAIAYLIVGWLLIQVVDIVFAQLHLPAWAGTFVTVLVIAGFPIAILLSWFLEFRDGRATLHELSAVDARKRRFSRTYLSVVSALTIAAFAVFVYDQSIGLPEAAPPATEASSSDIVLPPISDNSFAVLPFVNLDGSTETQIFADGLVDDVITQLSRVPGLRVASRGDAFSLQPNTPSQKVRARLRVAMYIEGSVEMAAEKMRVTVQMIDSETGFHILSRKFDRPLEDFFDIRDEITSLTVANVRVALPADTQASVMLESDRTNLDAYVLYRRGVDASRDPSERSTAEAVRWYDAALEVDPEFTAAHAGKCTEFVVGYLESGDAALVDSAESACATALELNPNLDVVHTALGNLYNTTGRLEEAAGEFGRALEADPNNVAALNGLGTTFSLQQQPDKAEESLRRAIGLRPGDWSPYNALGSFFFNSGRYEEATEQYEYVVALDSSNMVGYSNLGTAYMLAGDFAKAAPALKKSIDIEPRPSNYSSLGIMYYYLGEFDRAINAHRNATELAPNDPLTWSNLGDALWNAGRKAEARQAFSSAEALAVAVLEVNPDDPYTQMDLAWVKAMLDHPGEARELIDRARSSAPDDPYAHYIDALVHLRSGAGDAALDALELAAEKGYSIEMIQAEPHLEALRSSPRFRELTAQAEAS